MSKRQQYNHVRVTLTPTPPPPKTWTTPTYHLERYNIRRNVKTVNVQLHGLRGSEKRTESVSFPLLPNITDAELVRAAVWFSLNKWTVPIGTNVKQFSGSFSAPLNQQLLAALMGSSRSSSPGPSQHLPLPSYASPTVANASGSQPKYLPPIPQPGQFQQYAYTSNAPRFPNSSRSTPWKWYRNKSRKMQVGLGCGTIIALIIFISILGTAFGSTTASPPSTPTPANQAAQVVATATAAPTQQTAKPTATATPRPTVTATQKPTVQPATPRPTSPPSTPTPCPGVNCNPWGYSFAAGNYITSPDPNFCSYFACINNFWNGNGYVVECQDSMYSKSGGIQGACSHHGGVLRPLYSH